MGKRNKRRDVRPVPPATKVEIEFRVTIKELHSRTSTTCDKRSETFQFDFGHDFEAALAWLHSDRLWMDIAEFSDAARDRLVLESEAVR